jgi:putative toxin-antitoxin system antitoxin component (TIGR02293 family)
MPSKEEPMNTRVADAARSMYVAFAYPFKPMSLLLGTELESHADIVRLVQRGMPAPMYRRIAERLCLPANLIAPSRTLTRRLAKGHLSDIETERVLRIVRVFVQAMRVYGRETKTLQWFTTPAALLTGEPAIAPIILAASDSGAQFLLAKMMGIVEPMR